MEMGLIGCMGLMGPMGHEETFLSPLSHRDDCISVKK